MRLTFVCWADKEEKCFAAGVMVGGVELFRKFFSTKEDAIDACALMTKVSALTGGEQVEEGVSGGLTFLKRSVSEPVTAKENKKMTDKEAWVRFAAGAMVCRDIATTACAAEIADELLEELRERRYSLARRRRVCAKKKKEAAHVAERLPWHVSASPKTAKKNKEGRPRGKAIER